MSVGTLVGLRVMSTSGNTTASAFLTGDGSMSAIFFSTEEHILFFRGAHTHLGNLAT